MEALYGTGGAGVEIDCTMIDDGLDSQLGRNYFEREELGMIEQLEGFPEGTLAFRVSGRVTGADYDEVLTPALDEAMQAFDGIRIYMQVGPDFDGYSPEAAWDDTRLGLRHWRGFDRIVVVSDVAWVRSAITSMSFLMPCPVSVFELDRADDAKRWLSESLGSIRVDAQGENVTIALLGQLEPEAYEGVSEELDAHLSQHSHINLLLDLREFDGWQGLGGLSEHFSLVREHRRAPKRVAVVGDKAWHHLAERVFSKFIAAEVKYFSAAKFSEARSWQQQ